MKSQFNFNAKILILPGLGNSDQNHWQTHWEKQFSFARVEQHEWETPGCSDWIETLNNAIEAQHTDNILLVGHSLACTTIAYWSMRFKTKIKGALLVAPSDTEAPSYPLGTKGFAPVPLVKMNFPTIVVTSSNDFYVTLERAELFAKAWGSEFVNIGEAGHINVASGFGDWNQGLEILERLDT